MINGFIIIKINSNKDDSELVMGGRWLALFDRFERGHDGELPDLTREIVSLIGQTHRDALE